MESGSWNTDRFRWCRERRVGGIEGRRSVGDCDGFAGAADGELNVQAEHGGVVDGNILLEVP